MLPGAHEGAPPEPLSRIWMPRRCLSPRQVSGAHGKASLQAKLLGGASSEFSASPSVFPAPFAPEAAPAHQGSAISTTAVDTGGDHIANPSLLQNACVLRSVFCSESGCLGFQIKCSCWESQPANPHARKWSHLMSRGEAIGGWVSPEQLEICFLNKSSMVWSLWAAWVESLFSATISSAFVLFSGSIGGINAGSAMYRYGFTDCYLSKAVC